MNFLHIILIIIVITLVYMRIETRFVQVKEVMFTKNKNCLKIVQLSDIHINFLGVPARVIREVISSEKPDIILLTGDYVSKPSHVDAFLNFLKEINCGHNMYLSLGNHDFKAFLKNKKTGTVDTDALDKFIESIQSTNISVLHNRSICFEKNSKKYNITGISDMKYRMHNIEKAFTSASPDSFMNITISHNPDIVFDIPEGKADYLFCGHFHGGQIWAPFGIEFRLMRREKLCKIGIRHGLHKVNGINLYINRGIGNVLFPLRFLSRPEITVFYLP
ncbi:MAG: metallophosphoesterase [Clostridia bacterium]|nr:metallophosphoesterase [Clostridia bacterium]